MAININNFAAVVANANSNNTILNPFDVFDDSFTTGKVATFDFYDDSFPSEINVLLFDQAGDGASATVNNFINYVNDGDYLNSIIHRSASSSDGTPFVIQGGGFIVNDFAVSDVPTDAPVVNEFSPGRSNTRGTIAMAKLNGDPDSATSQWFFNLSDNSENLNNQNGGFTVFGQVLAQSDLDAIDQIASFPIFNLTDINPAFNTLPLDIDPANPALENDNDFIRLENVTLSDVPELSFAIENNTNPDVVTATIDTNGNIQLDYAGILNTPIYRFQNSSLPGTFLFVTEQERQDVLNNFPVFEEEGLAFKITSSPQGDATSGGDAQITVKATNLLGESVTDTLPVSVTEDNTAEVDELIAFNRFRNRNVDGTYLYATEEESQTIRQNFPEFVEEGLAFYAFGADANTGVDYYRFQNTAQPGTYIFVGEGERQSILANFPQFQEEGVAFKVM